MSKNCQKLDWQFFLNKNFWQFFFFKCQVFGNFLTVKWQFCGGSDTHLLPQTHLHVLGFLQRLEHLVHFRLERHDGMLQTVHLVVLTLQVLVSFADRFILLLDLEKGKENSLNWFKFGKV